MGKCYSLDLRKRLAARIAGGASCREAAQHFGVSASCSVKLSARKRQTGSLEPCRQGRPKGSGKLARFRKILIEQVEQKPDITMPELAAKLKAEYGVEADPASLSRFLCKAGFTYKKNADSLGTPPFRYREKTLCLDQ